MNAWIAAIAGLAAGALAAWSLASSRLRRAGERSATAEAEAAALKRQQESDRLELERMRASLGIEMQAKAAAVSSLEAERRNLEEQRNVLREAEAKLTATFKALAGEVLASQSRSFLELANERFGALRAAAAGDLSVRQEAIAALVNPLGESLKTYGEMVREMEKARAQAYGSLASEIKGLLAASESLQRETGSLSAALKGGSQVRGRWGELTLRRVVELAGLSDRCDFTEQESFSAEGGNRQRPDLIVNLPGGRRIAVDAKAPLQPFLDATVATTDAERRQRLESYAQRVRGHMNQLGARAYFEQLHPSPELVVLFLPGESFFSAALEVDRDLIEDGMAKRVVIATPTTLIALLHAVAYGWRQEKLEENAQEVSDLGRELYERVRVFVGHFADVGGGLRKAIDGYNRAAGSLEARVLSSARKFKELGAATGDEIAEVPVIDEAPRRLRTVIEAPENAVSEGAKAAVEGP